MEAAMAGMAVGMVDMLRGAVPRMRKVDIT
jgi:hypothetical protein